MQKFYLLLTATILLFFISCSKKTIPTKTSQTTIDYSKDSSSIKKGEEEKEVVEGRKAPVKEAKPTYPRIITVNDAAAKKAVDGRMYYDINGRRYWKNFKDGKYYLFDKSMYNNPDFKPKKDDT